MTMSRVRKRQPLFQVARKSVIHFIFFIMVVCAGIYMVDQFKTASHFPVKVVKIVGARHVNHDGLQQSLYPFVKNGFFGVEVEAIKDKLMQISWISNVSVRRVWPDQVIVTIIEKNPVAHWNGSSLLSTTGVIFLPDSGNVSENLPQLAGPEGKQIFVLQYYNRINDLLLPLHLKIARLELTPTRIWNVTLTNGMKLTISHKDFLTRFNHFVKVYPKIVGDRAADVDYVDLRYTNGLTVRWKTVT